MRVRHRQGNEGTHGSRGERNTGKLHNRSGSTKIIGTAAPHPPAAGTTRADGETVGFETEGTAIYDTMCFIKNEVCRCTGLSRQQTGRRGGLWQGGRVARANEPVS